MSGESSPDVAIQPLGGAGLPGTVDSAPTSAAEISDAIDAAANGHERGWDRLFGRFYGTVRRYAFARLGEADAADEIAQEVFVAAVKTIRTLRSRNEPVVEAWFLGITRKRIADRKRRQAREQRKGDSGVDTSPVADAAEVATSRLEAAEIGRCFDALTEDQRDVLVRRFILDQSLEDVAAATGRRIGAVKALQRRGLASLAQQLRNPEARR
jgi:RNA polymerase sigma-70 factor, ECF subfamily